MSRPALEALALAGGVAERGRIHAAGILDDARLILHAADLYVQPSRSEGISLAIMEAMDRGLPVVATPVGGIPEAVLDGTTGLLASSPTPAALAQALERMLAEGSRWPAMGQAGRMRCRSLFSGEQSVRDFVARYFVSDGR